MREMTQRSPWHPSTFGGLLRQYRLAAGLTQEALADRARLGARSIQDLERGVHQPHDATLAKLVDALALVGEPRIQLERAAATTPRRRGVSRSLVPLRIAPTIVEKPGSAGHNLPAPLTALVGRDDKLSELKGLLGSSRLVTLTGAAGCGKTRLALEIAWNLVETFPDGVWLVELAPLTDPALVPGAVATALGVHEGIGQPIQATLVSWLRSRVVLLVLDNCEHLIDTCARLADALLRSCPDLRILATSREALGIAGEVGWRVPSLTVPPTTVSQTLDQLASSGAVRLFLDRAAAVLPSFVLSEQNADVVSQICRRLDGIPLAIEMAATRVSALSVEQIARRLSDSFDLLTRGDRSALPRQRTLRATIDWSYDLLTGPERILFRRLAVFAGGFMAEAAEAVCAGEGLVVSDVLPVLVSLVDKSLVQALEDGNDVRYRLLETLREYGWERIAQANEGEALRNRHCDWCLALTERLDPDLWGVDATTALRVLETENDNLIAALEWCRQGDASAGPRLAANLWWFWVRRGRLTEGSRWLKIMLDLAPEQAQSRASALMGAGVLARDQGDMSEATSFLEESLRLNRQAGNHEGTALGLTWIGLQSLVEGDYDRAKLHLEESLTVGRSVTNRRVAGFALGFLSRLALCAGDAAGAKKRAEEMLSYFLEDGNPLGIAVALHDLGDVAAAEGDYPRARVYLTDALARRRDIGDPRNLAYTLSSLGELARLEGDDANARALLDEALGIFRDTGAWERGGTLASLGDLARLEGDLARAMSNLRESLVLLRTVGNRRGICRTLWFIALVSLDQSAPGRAVRLLASAKANAPRGVPFEPAERAIYDAGLDAARAALDENAFTHFWSEGQMMTLGQAIEFALSDGDVDG